MTDKEETNMSFKLSFLTSRETWIQQNIQFADQKAQTLIVINSAMVGALYSTKFLDKFTAAEVIAIIAAAILTAAVILCVVVLVPRGGVLKGEMSNSTKFASWEGSDYASNLSQQTEADLISDLSLFVVSLAKVSAKKYKYFPVAYGLSALGWITTGIWLIAGIFGE
jgi:hypothetical protein